MPRHTTLRRRAGALLGAALLAGAARAEPAPTPAPACAICAEWNAPQKPFQIYGNTYYVGVKGISSVLITSPSGHVLIDGALAESAPLIAANIRALGLRPEDIKLILNSHAHSDHAGGIAELQRVSGAPVMASASAALVLAAGQAGPDDPQYGSMSPFAPVTDMRLVHDRETVTSGTLEVTAHFTPGHTPGGTSWSWKSCEGKTCANLVFGDSLRAMARDGFKFSSAEDYPNALQDFERSFTTFAALPCDILLTAHPDPELLDKLSKPHVAGKKTPFEPDACRKYAASARASLAKRLTSER